MVKHLKSICLACGVQFVARAFRGWRKAKRNKREMKAFNARAGKPIRVEPEGPRELERERTMRGNGPGQGWRNY